jgi:hypothetical protein
VVNGLGAQNRGASGIACPGILAPAEVLAKPERQERRKTGKTAPGILPTKAFGILPAKAFNVSVRFFLQPLSSIDLKHLDCF